MRSILSRVLAILAVVCLGFILWYVIRLNLAASDQKEVREAVTAESERVQDSLEEIERAEFTGERDGEASQIPPDVLDDARANPVDFEKLAQYNSELYAWIRIPGTVIDYPIAQHEGEDENYYLNHDLYGEPRFAGCIYTVGPSSKEFDDPVTVLYGHNMRNGSMFGSLRNFLNAEFFSKTQYMYLYTPHKIMVCEIYSAHSFDDRYLPDAFDFTKQDGVSAYLEETLHPRDMRAQIRNTTEVTTNDRIVTLSTCIGGETGSRLLVQAVVRHESEGE